MTALTHYYTGLCKGVKPDITVTQKKKKSVCSQCYGVECVGSTYSLLLFL